MRKCPYCKKSLGFSVFGFMEANGDQIPGSCPWCKGNLIIKYALPNKVKAIARKYALTILLPGLAGVLCLWFWVGGVRLDTLGKILFYFLVLPTPFILFLAYVRYKSAEVKKDETGHGKQ